MSGILAVLLGTSPGAVIAISNQTINDTTGASRAATAGYRLTSGGQVQSQINATFAFLEQWCVPAAQAGNYEARVTVTSGSLSTGTAGSWLALTSNQTWTRTASIGSANTCVFTVEIRQVGTTTVLDSATITLEADATP
jgi:hypothetical protein